MINKTNPDSALLRGLLAAGASMIALGAGASALAQDETVEEIEEIDEEIEEVQQGDTVVVTGSRIRRNEFNSIAPVQVISGEVSRDLGLVDAAAILQDATASTGQQIDQTFNGFVLDNGPGASTVNLRALGADRNLVLLNGRRLAPGGVEGAPSNVDLNLIPSLMTERVELLLDGASSIYGSDAVAGVVNIILRKDFDGLELEAFRGQSQESGGDQSTFAAAWGFNSDRGFAGFGIEYETITRTKLNDHDFTGQCETHVEETPDGEIRRLGVRDNFVNNQIPTECLRFSLVGRFFEPNAGFGSVYFDPTNPNTIIPGGFSESNDAFAGLGVDADGDGVNEVQFVDYSLNGIDGETADWIGKTDQLTFFSYGEYNIGGPANITAFYEGHYANRRGENNGGPAQLFPEVPADNPFNPCNPAGVNGIDCGTAFDEFLLTPSVNDSVLNAFGITPAPGLLCAFVCGGPIGAEDVLPIVSVRGDRDSVEAEVAQFRTMIGLKGDIPGLEAGPFSNFFWETYGSYSRSSGTSIRRGIRQDRLSLSLETTIEDPANPGQFICGLDIDGDGIPDPGGSRPALGGPVAPDCVPVNLFAPSLYDPLVGDFATQAERDYLFGRRTFNTTYEQTVLNAFLGYDAFDLPGGTVKGILGFEFRRDEITSEPDDVAEDGLLVSFFSDGGATGERDLYEAYGELELPILAGQPGAEELTANISGRFTSQDFARDAWTYSAKVGYRPVDWLLLRGTYGTSYRAPNLRELFLRSQSGFLTVADPCVVPDDAISADVVTGDLIYDASQDGRDQTTLDNCTLAGIDPTTFGALSNGTSNANTSVEVPRGGSLTLDPETSDAWTAGFVFEQPWSDDFDLRIAANYYSITVEDEIIEPTPGFIVGDCFNNRPNLSSVFCDRISRGPDGRFDQIDLGFINRDRLTSKGVDIDVVLSKEFQLGDNYLELTLDLETVYTQEVTTTFINDDGSEDFDDNVGEFGIPEWNGRWRFFADYEDWRFTWSTRFIGAVSQDIEFRDEFDDAGGTQGTGFFGDTCLPGECVSRDVGRADAYFNHTASVRYNRDTWTAIFGVDNVFHVAPPLVDGDEVFSIRNRPIGAGYDVFGRTFFFNVAKSF
jgi:iron complex outermembrane receptor protein